MYLLLEPTHPVYAELDVHVAESSLYEASQILPNVALFLLVFVEFHAQLLFKIALFLLNFLNSTCATFNRCTTFIKISQL